MNMCTNGVIIDELQKFLHPKSKDNAKVVISQYRVDYNSLITLKFNDSIEFPNT